MRLSDIAKLPKFVLNNHLAYMSSSSIPDYDNIDTPTDDLKRADMVTSKIDDDSAGEPQHKIILDLDYEVQVIPSSTEGHFHLYLDKTLPWSKYEKLLTVLGDLEVVEPGYARAAKRRKYTSVRLPWVKKELHWF